MSIEAPAAPSPTSRRGRWILATVAALWAVVLVAATAYAVRYGEDTVPGQTSLADAVPTMDRAVADLVVAASATGAVMEITGYREVDAACMLTAARDGAQYERAVFLYAPVGAEQAVLDQVRQRLPASYRARVSRNALSADAGSFVAVRGRLVGAGELRVTVDTGCRARTGPVPATAGEPDGAERAPAEAALTALGVREPRWRAYRVGCPDGSAVRTATAEGAGGKSIVDTLGSRPAVVSRPDLYVYRDGPVGVAVRDRNGTVLVSATTGCGQ